MQYLVNFLILSAIYVILGLSLDLMVGRSGFLSLAHAAFYGIGAYSSALLTTRAGVSFLLALFAGALIAAAFSLVLSLISSRLRQDFFVIATLGFQILFYSLCNNWRQLTQGPMGIGGIPYPSFAGIRLDSPSRFILLCAATLGCALVLAVRISSSPFGRALRVLREDEELVSSLGRNPMVLRCKCFAVSAAMAASAGSLYAHYISYIEPSNFTIAESVLILSMVIVGGVDSIVGVVVGAFILNLLPEALRFLGLPPLLAASIRQMIFGAALIGILLMRPRGLVGRYDFGR